MLQYKNMEMRGEVLSRQFDDEATDMPSEAVKYRTSPFSGSFWRHAYANGEINDDIENVYDHDISWQNLAANGSRRVAA